MSAQSSGWRALKPVVPRAAEPHTSDKQDLFEASRLAMRALNLAPACRFVLEHLVGVYGGKLVGGRMMVWPANKFLEERTGISERTIRFALARLLELGAIAAVDSPNGKRFARRNAAGEIVSAFGFDLSPLLNRYSEFMDIVTDMKEQERLRLAAHDELTVHRRSTQEALRALAEQFPDTDAEDLMKRALELVRVTPRRSSKGSTEAVLHAWSQLRMETESRYYSACGGNIDRHKDNNKYAPENPCNNGHENVEEAKPRTNARDLVAACPDAVEFMGEIRSDGELIAAAGRFRGMVGVSPSAWEEARREIGPLLAAATLVYAVQLQMTPTPGSEPIRNLGGYYRVLVRLILDGRFRLDREIDKLKKNRVAEK
ncbi:plasmid replication protein RepC [Agrobacterium sp. CG674]